MSFPTSPLFKPSQAVLDRLRLRMGEIHAQQRLGIEQELHQKVLSGHGKFFHLENWYSVHGLIRACFRLCGLHQRAVNNTTRIQVKKNHFHLPNLPGLFEGYRILHISDLHGDMYAPAHHSLIETVRNLEYDLCVLTGDYRAQTFGEIEPALDALSALRTHLHGDVYAVLGNHDSIAMVPAMEDMAINLLLNEAIRLQRDEQSLFLAGVDDAHYYRVDNVQQALNGKQPEDITLLLSHTPEIYRQAAHAGVDIFLCGHTHGGQICLPGGFPITLDIRGSRKVGKGFWQHGQMQGYTSAGAGTSVVNLRLNCPPEVTLHTLSCKDY